MKKILITFLVVLSCCISANAVTEYTNVSLQPQYSGRLTLSTDTAPLSSDFTGRRISHSFYAGGNNQGYSTQFVLQSLPKAPAHGSSTASLIHTVGVTHEGTFNQRQGPVSESTATSIMNNGVSSDVASIIREIYSPKVVSAQNWLALGSTNIYNHNVPSDGAIKMVNCTFTAADTWYITNVSSYNVAVPPVRYNYTRDDRDMEIISNTANSTANSVISLTTASSNYTSLSVGSIESLSFLPAQGPLR